MPTYEYECGHCGNRYDIRRMFDEMDVPGESLCCGAVLRRRFSANGNIYIPIHMRMCLEGGQPGGGALSWSDFHDVTERELAHEDGVEPVSYRRSRSGGAKTKTRK